MYGLVLHGSVRGERAVVKGGKGQEPGGTERVEEQVAVEREARKAAGLHDAMPVWCV
jgi:hypothetical protein